MCTSRKYLDTHPLERPWKFRGRGGGGESQEPKFILKSIKLNLEIPGGRVETNKNVYGRGGIFSGTTQCVFARTLTKWGITKI